MKKTGSEARAAQGGVGVKIITPDEARQKTAEAMPERGVPERGVPERGVPGSCTCGCANDKNGKEGR